MHYNANQINFECCLKGGGAPSLGWGTPSLPSGCQSEGVVRNILGPQGGHVRPVAQGHLQVFLQVPVLG